MRLVVWMLFDKVSYVIDKGFHPLSKVSTMSCGKLLAPGAAVFITRIKKYVKFGSTTLSFLV